MNKYKKLIIIYILLLPYIDLITSLISRFTNLPLSLGMIIKGITLLFVVIYTFFYTKSKYKKISSIYLIILFVFMAIYMLPRLHYLNFGNLYTEISYMFRYMHFPIMLAGVINLFEDFDFSVSEIKKILFYNCISYTILLLVPYLTGTSFSSYNYSSVPGENGWFYAANETGTIMIILLTSIYYFMNRSNVARIFYTIPILIGVALISTKVSYFGMILVILLLCILFVYENKGKRKTLIIPILLIFITFVVCNLSYAIDNFKGTINNINESEKIEVEKPESGMDKENVYYNDIYDLVKNKNVGKTLKILLNRRDQFFINNLNIFINGNLNDRLFGIGWTNREDINYTFEKKLIEIDYLDIFIHYGIIGFLIYFSPLVILIFRTLYFIIKDKTYDKKLIFYFFVLLLILGISSFSGHVLAAPAVSIYVVLIIMIIIMYMTKRTDLKENKITILALHLGTGGIEKYISSLCKMLNNKYEIEIISTYKLIDKPSFNFDEKIQITYLINDFPRKNELKSAIKNKQIFNILKYGLHSLKILLQKYFYNSFAISNIDSKYIITTRYFHSSLVGLNKKTDQISIATEHNYHNNDKKYIKRVVKSCQNMDYLILVSEELQSFYSKLLKNTECTYIPNVIENIPKFNEHKKINQKIISIGRLVPEKGFLDLVDIISIVKEKINDIKLDIYGDGNEKEIIEKKIKTLKLENNITLCGFCEYDTLLNKMSDYDIYAMTSYTESFGLVLIEAMSRSLPCIAFDDANGAKNLLAENNGILISNRDKIAYANKIISLLKNIDNLNKQSLNGYNSCKKYEISTVQKQWLKLLK